MKEESLLKDFMSEPPTMIKGEVIYLFDADLILSPKNEDIKFKNVGYHSFRSSSITVKEIQKADLIIFISHKNKKHKILKSRYF